MYLYAKYLLLGFRRALRIIDKYFVQMIMKEQDVLGTNELLSKFLTIIDEDLRKSFEEAMLPEKTSVDRWNAFLKHYDFLFQRQQIPKSLRNLKEEIKLQFTYPRLDINVTKGLNHLLKAPFCVHPKSGKICVPFSPKLVDKFDPSQCPTINLLVDEINAYDAKTKEQEEKLDEKALEEGVNTVKRIKDYKKTSLLKPVNIFEEFLRGFEIKVKSEVMEF